MRRRRRRVRGGVLVRILLGLTLAETAWLLYPTARARLLAVEDTSATRGLRLAATLGCFTCHGPAGSGGTHNPGSEEGSVPAFVERTQMMYVKTTEDLREYILDGAPHAKRDDPDYRAKMEAAALRMPAYRAVVTTEQLEDLVAYLRATSGMVLPEEAKAAHGAELAGDFGCFGCHGPMGSGGAPNPRSFKGYIPGFWGADFDELVRDDDELQRWIEKGEIPRIASHPIGNWFFSRQLIKMPAFERFLAPEDTEALMAYVRWVRAGAWRPLIR